MMNNEERYNYENCMREGDCLQKISKKLENTGDLVMAEYRCKEALHLYEKAYDIAKDNDILAEHNAYAKIMDCQKQLKEISYHYGKNTNEDLSQSN